MLRQSHIIKTGIYPKLQHIFSTKKYKIFRAYQRQTADSYLTKVVTAKDQKVFKLYKSHIVNNILPYLVELRYLKLFSELNLDPELCQIMVKSQEQKDLDQDFNYEGNEENVNEKLAQKYQDSNTILLTKKMIKGMTLREMILNKDKRLDEEFCLDLIGEIVDFLLTSKRLKDLFITTENIIVEDTGLIYFNYFSFTGLQFIKYEKFITKVEFQELLPYLTPKLISEQSQQKRQIDIEVDLRFIVLNYLSAYFKKDLLFDSKHFNLEVQVRRTDQNIILAVQKVTNSLLANILSAEQKQKMRNHKTNIWKLMKYLNLCRDKEQQKVAPKQKSIYSWQMLLQNLSTYTQKQGKSSFQMEKIYSKDESDDEKATKEKIKEFLNSLNYRFAQNSEFIATVFHNLVDLFTDIVSAVAEKLQRPNTFKHAKKVIHLREVIFQERKEFIQSKRYSKSVYIPIKTGMKFATILKYKNWVNMLQESTSTNQSTLQAITKLVQFITTINETMITIGPLISQPLIQIIIQKKQQQSSSSQNGPNRDHDEIFEQLPFHQLLTNLFMNENMRQQFWKLFFAITNKILLLVKKFYLKTTSHKVIEDVEINRHDFRQIFEAIKEYIPPLSPLISQQQLWTEPAELDPNSKLNKKNIGGRKELS